MTISIDELRRINLARLVMRVAGDSRGSQVKAAEKMGLTEVELSQYLNKHKRLGNRKARAIEKALDLPENWLDTELHGYSPDVLEMADAIQSLPKDDREHLRALIKRMKK